jgi:hypothetical protein
MTTLTMTSALPASSATWVDPSVDGATFPRLESLDAYRGLIMATPCAAIRSWEQDGMVIWYKRLEAGTFQQLDPEAHAPRASGSAGIEQTVTVLALPLTRIDLSTARRRNRYTRAG